MNATTVWMKSDNGDILPIEIGLNKNDVERAVFNLRYVYPNREVWTTTREWHGKYNTLYDYIGHLRDCTHSDFFDSTLTLATRFMQMSWKADLAGKESLAIYYAKRAEFYFKIAQS